MKFFFSISLVLLVIFTNGSEILKEMKDECPYDIDTFFEVQYNDLENTITLYEKEGCDSKNEAIQELCKLEEYPILGAHVLLNMTILDIRKIELMLRKVCDKQDSSENEDENNKIEL